MISLVEPCDDSRITRIRVELEQAGHTVSLVMPPARGTPSIPIPVLYALPVQTRHFRPESTPGTVIRALASRVGAFIKALRCVLKLRPDVCHCHEPDSWLIGVLAQGLRKSRVVVDIHEVYTDRAAAFPRWLRPWVEWMIRASMVALSRRTAVAIHVSQSRAGLHSHLVCHSQVVNNYPDGDETHAVDSSPLPPPLDAAFDSNAFILIHAGPLRINYAAPELLAAIASAHRREPRVRLVVLGGTRGPTTGFSEQMAQLEAEGALRVLPHQDAPTVRRCLARAQVALTLVRPVDLSHRYAVPRKMFEYLAAGLPVLGSDAPDVRRVLTEHQCGVVLESLEPEEMAGHFLALARDPERVAELARNAQRAAAFFRWESERAKIRDLYASLPPSPAAARTGPC
jgi:glycosyltransferase involved in cell wall biosynthesis